MPRILLVDGKSDNLVALSAQLARRAPDWELLIAASCTEGIQKARTQSPDLILLEVPAPESEGYTLLRRLKSAPATRTIPIAVLTPGEIKPHNGNSELLAQADVCLPRLESPDLLATQLRALLRLKQAEDRLRAQHAREEQESRSQIAALTELNERLHRQIEEQRNAHEHLRQEIAHWEAAFESTEDAVFLADAKLNLLRCNQAFVELVGRPREELIGTPCCRLVHQTKHPPHICPVLRARESRESASREWRINGRWYHIRATPIFNAEGKLHGYAHVMREVTRCKRYEHLLDQEWQALELINQDAPLEKTLALLARSHEKLLPDTLSAVLLLDAPRRKLRLQAAPSLPEACRRALDGLSLEQAGGSCGAAITSREPVIVDDLDTLPPGDELRDLARKHGLRSCWILPLQKAAGEVVGTFHIYSRQPRRPEPHELALLERSGRVAALAIEQERTRKSLQESERILRRAQAMAHVGCWCRDFERNQVIWSEEAYRIFQIAPGTPMSYQLLLDFVHPEDRARVDQAWQNMRFGHPRNLEYRVVVKGQIRWIRSNAEVEMTPDGRLRRITGIVQDITPHRQAVAGQRASEERFRGIIEHSTQLHYEHSPDHVLTYVSPQSWHFLGCSPEEARVHWKDFLSDHPQNQEGIRATQRAIDTGTPQPPYELELLTRDGRKLWVEVHESPVVKEGRTVAIVGALLDITERKRFQAEHRKLEAHLRQQEKLDAVGTLAAGVAHEINNPISGIMGYADILREEAPEGSRIREFAGEILHESERVATIVRNLLTFARQEEPEHVPTSVPELIEATLSLVQAIVKQDHIRLETELAPEMPLIYCQFQQLQQVLMNLTTNARDALNAKYPEPHPDKILRIITSAFTEKGKPWVRFTVEDHGAGIPPEVLDRIYEPFFTTKPRGKGTGLGLSISLGIIQDHRGRLRVETRRGHYTRFHVELPAHPPESESANRAAPTP